MNKNFKQPFVEVPGVGLVTSCPVGIDGPVRAACKGIFELKNWQIKSREPYQHFPLAPINWYQAMMVAKTLGLRLLTLPEYWASYHWASPQYKHAASGRSKSVDRITDPDLSWFIQEIGANTWTSTVVIWDREDLVSRYLLDSHGYEGKLPVVIHAPEVTPDPQFDVVTETKDLNGDCTVTARLKGYRLEGGQLIKIDFLIPEPVRIDFEVFDPDDLDNKTGLPKGLRPLIRNHSIENCSFCCDRTGIRAAEWCGALCYGLNIYNDPHHRFDSSMGFQSQFFAVKI